MFNLEEIMADLDITLDCGNCQSKLKIKMIEMRQKIVCECGQALNSDNTERLEKSIELLAYAHLRKFALH